MAEPEQVGVLEFLGDIAYGEVQGTGDLAPLGATWAGPPVRWFAWSPLRRRSGTVSAAPGRPRVITREAGVGVSMVVRSSEILEVLRERHDRAWESGARPSGPMNSSMNTEKLRDHWVAELTPPPAAAGDGAVSEPLLQALLLELGTAAVPILRPDPGHTWIWSDLHLGDLAMVEAWNRPFRNLTHMNRALLAEWRRRIRSSDTIICLGDVAHPDAWRDHSRLQLDLTGCPGERLLILGNHDFHTREELALAGFDKQYAAAVCDTRPVLILTHMPLSRVPTDTVNLHGHLHAALGPTRHHRNLSVERTGYQPVRLSEVLASFNDVDARARSIVEVQ